MNRLGYTRYVAQGGDVGALVTDVMSRQAPRGLAGIHTNLLATALGAPQPADSEEERAARDALTEFSWVEKAYPNLVYFNEVDRGGYFAAWEEPQLFAGTRRVPVASLTNQ